MHDNHFHGGRLENRAVLAVTGLDAAHFLHNLLTSDVEQLEDGAARYAALLNPQGKILFDMIVLRRGDGFLIDCAADQRAELMKRLSMYRLRARVEIAARDDLAVSVSPAEIAGGFPDPRTPEIGWRAMGPAAGAAAEGYDAARIAQGLADSAADIGSGETFPHEANLDQLGGVSFRKGCYVGQEVVSRMEHRGTARNRMLPVRLSGAAPAKGTSIRSGDRQVGTLLSSSGGIAIALLRLDRLAEATGPLVADGVDVTVIRPRWARYDVPGAA